MEQHLQAVNSVSRCCFFLHGKEDLIVIKLESLLPNRLGLKIIQDLEEMGIGHTIIACTRDYAAIQKDISPEGKKM